MSSHLEGLEKRIVCEFKNKNLFTQALTHSSHANEHRLDHSRCNERPEFLGDAVLEVVTSEFLYRKYETLPEGDLTKTRVSIVCGSTLTYCTGNIKLGQHLYLGKGRGTTGGRNRDSVVSDAMEVLIDAIYLDGGFADAREFIHRSILDDVEHKQLFYDSKTILQEMVQSRQEAPLSYEIIREKGPDRNKPFEVYARIGDKEMDRGVGCTKKATEQVATCSGILKLKTREAATEE